MLLSGSAHCYPWIDSAIGTAGTASATFDACNLDSLTLVTNAAMSGNAAADNQHTLYQTLCGNGELIVKVDQITATSGYAGLFVRESMAPGARKVALMTQKGNAVFRQLRVTTNQFQQQAQYTAPGHAWLKLIRTGNNVVGQWSTNGATWNTAFNTPFIVSGGCVEIGIFTYSSSTGTTVTGGFSNLQYTPPAPEPAVVSFTDSLLTVSPGDSVEICLNLSSECNCETVNVEIDTMGSGSPHFANFSIQALSLTMTDSTDCFKIPVDSNLASGIYMFKISNLNGHSTPVSGTDSILIVNVEGQESSTTLNCGAWEPVSVLDSTQSYLFQDRFGGQYSLADIKVPTTVSSFSTSTECHCDEFDETEVPYITDSYFNLSFADCLEGTGVGFDHPTYGREYRRAACRAFAYVAHRISAQTNVCGSGGNEGVNIRIELSDGPLAESLSNGTYAAASPFYEYAYLEGINNGMVWKKIIGGADDILFVDDPVFHGSLVLNVDPGANNTPNPNFSYYTGDAAPGPGDYDLYTIILHEATHLLGFASLLGVNGFHILNLPCHNHFDTHLRLNTPSGVIPVVQRSPTNPFDWGLNSGIGIGGLYNSCNGVGPDLIFEAGGNNNIIIFTGSSHQNGSSFSHIATACEGPSLMGPNIGDNTRFEYSGDELLILCSLGYEIDNDASCSCAPVAVNDDTPHCEETFWHIDLCEGESIEFTLEDILGDDPRADVLNYIEVVPTIGEITNPGELEGPVDGLYTYTTCQPGISFIRYEAAASDCTTPGSMGVIGIRVSPCLNCEESQQAGYNQNPCNLICNPEIVADFPAGGRIAHIGCFCEADTYIPNWGTATQSADAFLVPSVFGSLSGLPDNGSLYMIASRSPSLRLITESIFTPLPSLSEGCYFYSYFYSERNNGAPSGESCIMRSVWIDEAFSEQFTGCGLELLSDIDWSAGGSMQLHEAEIATNTSGFIRTGATFELTANLSSGSLFIYPDAEIENPGEAYGIHVDQFELLPDNFSAGENISAFCGDPIVLGGEDFCMLSDVAIRYTWKDEADEVLLSYTVRRGFDGQLFIEDDLGSPLSQVPALEFTALNSAVYTLERTVASGSPFSIDLCTTSDEVAVTVTPRLPQSNFTFSGGGCEDEGSFTFTAGAVLPEATYSWNFGDGTTATGQVVEHTFPAPLAYTVALTVNNACGESVFTQQVLAPDCLECEDCISSNTIGLPGNTTNISVIGAIPAGAERCVEGTLVIDQNTTLTNCHFRMGAGAAIKVEEGILFTINNTRLEGCTEMWRGIIAENGSSLTITGGSNSLIADAALGIHIISGSLATRLDIYRGCRFEKNYVSLYKGKGLTPLNLIRFEYAEIKGGPSGLKPEYPGMSQLIEDAFLPPHGGKAWAGVWLEDITTVPSFKYNDFSRLSVGIFVKNSSFVASYNKFSNIVNGHIIPPQVLLQYLDNIKGCAIYARGSAGQLLRVDQNPAFSLCETGIRLEGGGLMTVSSNIMNGVINGVYLQNIVGGATINANAIDNARKGIRVLSSQPGSILNIHDNVITINPFQSSNADVGIELVAVDPMLLANAAEVYGNDIELSLGRGIILDKCQHVRLRNNPNITLSTASVRAGIWIENSKQCEILENTITGAGTSLPSGALPGWANVGIYISSSMGNAYCCNEIDNTHIGIMVSGASASENRLRGNALGASHFSLYLPDDNAIIGSQGHTKNCWESGSGGAVYAAPSDFAELHPFIVDELDMACFKPGTYSPTEWFRVEEDEEDIVACLPEVCNAITNFKPDSPDTKRFASGELSFENSYPEALTWELQRYVYARLQISPPTDSLVQAFVVQSDSSRIGQFEQIHTDWAGVFNADSSDQVQVAAWLKDLAMTMDSIALIEEQMLNADSSLLVSLLEDRANWQLLGDSLGILADTLMADITDNREILLTNLRTQNNSISTATAYELNEQLVNDQFLAYYVNYEANPDSADLSILTTIANQCPLLGGHGVYTARALLTVLTGLRLEYNDSTLCAVQQAIRIPAPPPTTLAPLSEKVYIYPNPANQQVHLIWTQALKTSGRLVVYDLLGQSLLTVPIPADQTSYTLPLGQLQNGLYWFQIELDGVWSAHKIMIHH